MNINKVYNYLNIYYLQSNVADWNYPIVNKMKHMLIFQDVIRYIVCIDLIFSSKFKL
jgi:hypothetical protein